MAAKTGATAQISYEEFEPFCKWQREEARDTLIIHLPDFKKEQMKVHINNRGIMKVSGERKVDATKRSKFSKEVVVPRNCDTHAIQAKFVNKHLYVVMPKKIDAAAVPEQKVSTLDPNAKPEGEAGQPQELGKEKESTFEPSGTPKADASGKSNGTVIDGEVTVSKGKQLAKIALSVGMPVALLVALLAFVVYMYKSTVVED